MGIIMKRFTIVLLLFAMIFTIIGCGDTSESDPVVTSTIPSTSTTESKVCVEHNFTDGSLLIPRRCLECNFLDGEPLYKQCETWEDVIACLYFDDMPYDLTVTEAEDGVTLVLEFTDANQFATEEQVKEFMVKALVNLPDIIGLTQGSYLGMSVDTPDYFRKDTTVFLAIPGGTIGCVPYDGNWFGIATCLIPDEEFENLAVLAGAYNTAFASTNVEYELE